MRLIKLYILASITSLTLLAIASCKPEKEVDFNFEATNFYGEFNGDIGSSGEYNYYIHLSDKGFSPDGTSLPEGTYYRFDIFSTAPQYTDRLTVPTGKYVLGTKGATVCGTFTPDYSLYYVNGSNGTSDIQLIFSSGTLNVTCENDIYTFEAHLTDVAGMTHHVKYTGQAVLADNSMNTGQDYLPLDKDLEIAGDSLLATDYGTVEGFHNIILSITDMQADEDGTVTPPGSILNLDCYMSLDEDGILPGKYGISELWGLKDFTLSPGEKSNGQYVGSLVENFENGQAYLGFITSGEMDLERTGTGSTVSYSISCSFTTGSGNTIQATYNGPIVLTKAQPSPAAAPTGNISARPILNPMTRAQFHTR